MGGVQSFPIRAVLLSERQQHKLYSFCVVVFTSERERARADQTRIGCIVS